MNIIFQSKRFFLYAGKHCGEIEELLSFDRALIAAGVACYNLVKVSSILPPFFMQDVSINVEKGNVLHTAFASSTQKGKGIISAAVAVGLPVSENDIGVIMEYSCNGIDQEAVKVARNMVTQAMRHRNIQLKEILVVSSSAPLSQMTYSTVVAGIALW